jgi:16S rRNA (cytosine1402-N4)-methyltransferase
MENEAPQQDSYVHKTVLLHESIDGLAIEAGDTYLDGTLGSAGHALYAATVQPTICIVGLDRDPGAIARATKRLEQAKKNGTNIFLINENYRNLDLALDSIGTALGKEHPSVNRIMLDLGLSSDQFETSGRGFSFQKNEPLLMTFKENLTEEDLTAREIVNTWDEENIADIIYGYGEETYARKIAKGIVAARAIRPIETTFDLVEAIKSSTPGRYHKGRIHPATKTFQALRITVNDEIGALKEGLAKGFERLAPGGRMAVISFHSIEDRIVKHFYKEKAGAKIITKKPLTPSETEIKENPRSRSAKLRIIQKVN